MKSLDGLCNLCGAYHTVSLLQEHDFQVVKCQELRGRYALLRTTGNVQDGAMASRQCETWGIHSVVGGG